MKKLFVIIFCCLFLLLNSKANSTVISDGATSKYNINAAYVDISEVLKSSKEYENLINNKNEKIKELERFVNAAKKEIQKQLTDEKKEELEKKYNKELKTRKVKLEKEFNKNLIELEKNISNAIYAIAKERGYTLVLSKKAVLSGGDDITELVKKTIE